MDIRITGLREMPPDGVGEEFCPYCMGNIICKLYPEHPSKEWIHNKGIPDGNGRCYHEPDNPRSIYKPDFRNDDLKIIIEIDGAGGRFAKHFCDSKQCLIDIRKKELYFKLGYKAIFIPMYIQLDAEMINYYFGVDYSEKLYPAADSHGFLHPEITLPADFCPAGIKRFKKEMDEIPKNVRAKVIETLRIRIQQYIDEGFEAKDARRKVILPSLDYLLE